MMRDALYGRLARLAEKTATAKSFESGGWWAGDAAGERRTRDDLAAGRLHWLDAHRSALEGIKALEEGNRAAAEAWAWNAVDLYMGALEILLNRIRPSENVMAPLQQSARRRGRPRKK